MGVLGVLQPRRCRAPSRPLAQERERGPPAGIGAQEAEGAQDRLRCPRLLPQQLKQQRDKLRQYQKRVSQQLEREREVARQLLRDGRKE